MAETLLLWPRMDLLEAGCHTCGTMATGGFSTRAASVAAFNVVSIMTTTGFATGDFDAWPVLTRALLVLSMLQGRLEVFTVIVLFHPRFWRR